MKILVAPLDWGLGHATRTIPIVRKFLAQGAEVDLAVSGKMSALFRGEFPDLAQVEIPGYGIRYPNRGFEMPFWLFANYRRIADVIRREHEIAERLARERGYDTLFSDNRFGFYAKGARNIYMTHQLRIAFPGPFSALENLGVAWHRRRMQRFDEIWVPDYAEFPGLAGKLSHVRYPESFSKKVKYIGPQSRFAKDGSGGPVAERPEREFDLLAILSGPEPMRTSFETAVLKAFAKIPGKHAVIRGLPGESELPLAPPGVTLFNHLETDAFAKAVKNAKTIVSRPGYSTVMDMEKLGAKCILVPTPGQTEQVYLGEVLQESGLARLLHQNDISAKNLCEAIEP